MPQYGALINNLIVTTDRFITGSSTASASSSRLSSRVKPRIAPVPLAWSVALGASQDITITIHASIEYVVCLSRFISLSVFVLRIGRSRQYIKFTDEPILINLFPLGYWRTLYSNLEFADQPLKSCVNIIHVDIIDIWNLYDRHRVSSPPWRFVITVQRNQYLSSNEFKINMSHVIKDPTIPSTSSSRR
jgi:hypothetical protein